MRADGAIDWMRSELKDESTARPLALQRLKGPC